jgi:hypothetical protein
MPPADVWSVGVMLVEVLTQAKPVWREDANGDMILGQEVPQPFLEIARNCLRRDPGRRSTLAEIALQLRGPARERKETSRAAVTPQGKISWKWIAVAAALALAIGIGVIAGRRNPEPAQGASETKPVQTAPAASAPAKSAPPAAKPAESKPSAAKAGKNVSAVKPSPSLAPKDTPKPTASMPRTVVPAAEVAQQVQPDVSQNALNTITGKVRVRIRVTADAAGNVSDTSFETEGPSKYFARKAMEAAQKWKFTGAGERVITFYFMKSGTEANVEAAR